MSAFAGITHLTFDCYGTLIDWERGILDAIQPILARHQVNATPEMILRGFVEHEAALERLPWRSYRTILTEVMVRIASDFNLTLTDQERATLVNTLPQWRPFWDTVAALRKLDARFRLVVLSNVDDDLFLKTEKQLGIRFDVVITAEQVRSYKPDPGHFREALRRLQVPGAQVLHVAQSLYHDHVPARQFGFRTARIKRPSLLVETGLAPAPRLPVT
ncbi:MAG: haloacid dehalogenase type II [Verrucomicrobiota bacterium]